MSVSLILKNTSNNERDEINELRSNRHMQVQNRLVSNH